LTPGLAIAAINSPTTTIISGNQAEAHTLANQWRSKGRKTRALAVSHAFHSPHMDPILHQLTDPAADLTHHHPHPPPTPTLPTHLPLPTPHLLATHPARHQRRGPRPTTRQPPPPRRHGHRAGRHHGPHRTDPGRRGTPYRRRARRPGPVRRRRRSG